MGGEVFDDLTKEIKAQLYERVRSPLFGAFALSWVPWNYRPMLASLSGMPFERKLAYLDSFYPSIWHWGWFCAGGPLLTAVLFLLLYPYPARWMYGYWANQHKELKKVQQQIEDETPITQEEASALRKVGLDQAREYQARLNELAASNKELEERVRLLQGDNSRLTSERDRFAASAMEAGKALAPQLDAVLTSSSTEEDEIMPSQAVESEISPSKTAATALLLHSLSEKQLKQLGSVIGVDKKVTAVFLALVILEGGGTVDAIATTSGLGKIDVRHGLAKLKERRLVVDVTRQWRLTDTGELVAVQLGVTDVSKVTAGPHEW